MADVVDRDRPLPVVGVDGRVAGQRVARVLVPGQAARARHDAVERPVGPRQVAVQVEPDAARPLRGVPERRARQDRLGVRRQQADGACRGADLGDAGIVARGRHRGADLRRPARRRRRADRVEEAADVRDQRRRLVGRRDAGEDRPRLRLLEDDALCRPARRRDSRASTSPRRSTRGASCRRRRAPAARSCARERVVAAQVGQLGELRVGVGELRRHEHRLGQLLELGREVVPVAGRAHDVAAVRAAQRLLVRERLLDVLPRRRRLAAGRSSAAARRRTSCRACRGRTRRPRAAARSRGRSSCRGRSACRAGPVPYGFCCALVGGGGCWTIV